MLQDYETAIPHDVREHHDGYVPAGFQSRESHSINKPCHGPDAGYNSVEELTGKPLSDLMIVPGDIENLASGIRQEGSLPAGRYS